MTGRYPHAAGHAMPWGMKAPAAYRGTARKRAPMISELLKKLGYQTYHVGKWHLNRGADLIIPIGVAHRTTISPVSVMDENEEIRQHSRGQSFPKNCNISGI